MEMDGRSLLACAMFQVVAGDRLPELRYDGDATVLEFHESELCPHQVENIIATFMEPYFIKHQAIFRFEAWPDTDVARAAMLAIVRMLCIGYEGYSTFDITCGGTYALPEDAWAVVAQMPPTLSAVRFTMRAKAHVRVPDSVWIENPQLALVDITDGNGDRAIVERPRKTLADIAWPAVSCCGQSGC